MSVVALAVDFRLQKQDESDLSLETVQKLASETFEHDSRRGDEDESPTVIGLDFVVFGKAAGEGKPSESTFDNPPAGQDFEGVSMQVAALDNLDSQTAIGNELLDSSQKLLAKVSGISPDVAQPSESQAHFLEKFTGTGLIRDIGRGD